MSDVASTSDDERKLLALLDTIIHDGEELIQDLDVSLARIEKLEQRRSVAAALETESRAETTAAQEEAASPVDGDDQATKQIVDLPSSSLDFLVQVPSETAHAVGETEIGDALKLESLATVRETPSCQSPTQTESQGDPLAVRHASDPRF